MWDVILDTVIDSLKLLPFLFVAFLLIELLEHKFSKKSKKIISKTKWSGPFLGSILGVVPQCGFSVMATNLYVTRIVTLGTLFSVYLSTSDEMLPILISEKVSFNLILIILLFKVFIGMFCGFVIDFIFRKKNMVKEDYHMCEDDHCHCENGILKSSILHTLKTIGFIFLITLVLNILMNYGHDALIDKLFLNNTLFTPFISSLIGLIPNCGASVIITELYLNGAINFGSLIAGVLTNSGVALIVLFKQNKNIRENITIVLLLYFIGVLSGVLINLVSTYLV